MHQHPLLSVPPPDPEPPAGMPLEDARGLAQLAFESFSQAAEFSRTRHLALLPSESLELDLDDPAQRQFGDYELLELLGEGGMGVVYRARQNSLDREVAVKLLSAGPWASRDFIARFEREAQNAARMQHPNIVTVYEVGTVEGLQFFSMRLVRGESLASKLKRGERFSPKAAAALMRTMAEAVGYAHSLGVLHLDLKPANVLLDETDTPYVADFGLARRLENALAIENDEVSGTPAYMAPEQAQVRAYKLTAATDIWGLGAILYELLTGRPPFRADTAQDTVKLVLDGQVRAPRRWQPSLPLDLQAIVLRCLNRDSAERYPSARALADDLARYAEGRPVQARPLNAAQRVARWSRREPKLAITAVLAFGLLVVGLAATTQQWRRADANAHAAQAKARIASGRLWDSRDAASLGYLDAGDGWSAAPQLLANIAEMEAAGAKDRALVERKKIGIIERSNPRLLDVIDVPDVGGLAFDRQGSNLAISAEGSVRVRNLATGAEHKLDNPTHVAYTPFERMRFSTDGKSLVTEEPEPMPGAPYRPGFQNQFELARTEAIALPPGYRNPWAVLAATYSDDGRYAVLTDKDAYSQVWATRPWRALSPKRRLSVNPGLPFVFAQFAPDGSWLAVAHQGGLALVDARTLRETRVQLPVGFSAASVWAVSPDSRWLVVGDHEGRAAAVEHAAKPVVRVLKPQPPYPFEEFAFSGDGTRLLAAAGKGGVYMWQWPLGELVVPPFGDGAVVHHVLPDGHGERVLAAGESQASIWQIPAAAFAMDRREAVRVGDRFRIGSSADRIAGYMPLDPVAWNPAKGLLAEAGDAVRVQRLPAPVLKALRASPIQPATLRFDGARLAAVDGNRVRIVDAMRETSAGATVELPQPPAYAELTPDGATLVVIAGRRLYAFDAKSGAPRFAPVDLANSPLHVEINPDGASAVTGWLDRDKEGTLEVLESWDLANGRRLGGPVRVRGPLWGVQFSATGRRLLAGNADQIGLRDGRTLQTVPGPLAELDAPGRSRKDGPPRLFGGFDFDGERPLIYQGGNDDAELLHLDAGGRLQSQKLGWVTWQNILPLPGTHGLLVAPGDGSLAVRSPDGKQRRWQGTLQNPDSPALAVSKDRRWVAHGLHDGVELFDARTGKRLAAVHGALPQPDRVWQVAFGPDGNRLVARSVHNRWLVWDIAPDTRPVAAIRREFELRGIKPESESGPARPPLRADERATLRARDPGAPVPIAMGAPIAARRLPGGTVLPRSPDAPPATLDLTDHYNLALGEVSRDTQRAPSDYLWLPQGVQRLLGIDYDIRGAIQLTHPAGFAERATSNGPDSVQLEVAGRRTAALDVLMLENHGGIAQQPGADKVLATAILAYTDGSRAELPIRYGDDVLPWQFGSDSGDARIALMGRDARTASLMLVYAVHLPNPYPEKALRAMTVSAAPGSGGGNVVLAVTLEPTGAAAPIGNRERRR